MKAKREDAEEKKGDPVVAARFRAIREELGVRQVDLMEMITHAAVANGGRSGTFDQTYISKLETGAIRADTLHIHSAYAAALNLTRDEWADYIDGISSVEEVRRIREARLPSRSTAEPQAKKSIVTRFAARLKIALDALKIGVVALDKGIAVARGGEPDGKYSKGYTTKALQSRDITLEMAESVAVTLGVRPAWLLLGEGEMLSEAKTPTYSELPGWRLAESAALDHLPRTIPLYAIEAAARRPVLAQPKVLGPSFVVALARFWFDFASDAEVEAAERASTEYGAK